MTRIIDFKEDKNSILLKECADAIRNSGVVVFPTETVYGIGANALDKQAVDKIFSVKKRKSSNPLIVLVSDFCMLNSIVRDVNDIHKKLIDNFWPGPLTIVFDKKEGVLPDNVTAGLMTVGVRIPGSELSVGLIKEAGVPITAPSANISGKLSITDFNTVCKEFYGKVDYIIDGGISDIGIESTIVRIEKDTVNILRCGKILPEDIEKIGLKVNVVDNKLSKNKHYDIGKRTLIVTGENSIDKILNFVEDNKDKKVAVIGFDEHYNVISSKVNEYIKMGSINNYDEILKNFFKALNQVKDIEVDVVLIESIADKKYSSIIMKKLNEVSNGSYL